MTRFTKTLFAGAAAAALSLTTVFGAFAASEGSGLWCQEGDRWWFKLNYEGTEFLANTWYYIKDTDGVIRCYFFDESGWLVTNATVDGFTVDADGHYTENGEVVTYTEDQVTFRTQDPSLNFAPQGQQAQVQQTEQTAQPAENTVTEAAPATGSGTSGTISSKKKVVKSSGGGDNPANAEAEVTEVRLSDVSGSTASNSWSNFRINYSGVQEITTGNTENNIDFQIMKDDALLTFRYLPLSYYGASDLESFAQSLRKDRRSGAYGATVAGYRNLGSQSFLTLTKAVATPDGDLNDNTYVRMVSGTSYVLIIQVERNGSNEDFSSVLATM